MKFPQCTIRDLFWLVLVCGMAVGWWRDRAELATTLTSYRTEIEECRKHAQSVSVIVDEEHIKMMRGHRMIIEAEEGSKGVIVHFESLTD